MDVFITGTDTGVGKTVVTAGIAAVMQGLGYSVGVYKPVQSGTDSDIGFVKSIDSNIRTKCSYAFRPPVAPALAADLEGVKVDTSRLLNDYNEFKKENELVLVEGAGGLLVPVVGRFLIRDLVKLLKLPLLIVARPNLGTINHTLLTIEAAKNAGIEVLGVVFSNFPRYTQDEAIKNAPRIINELSGVRILGALPIIGGANRDVSNPELLIDAVINYVNIQEILKIKIPKLQRDYI